MRKRGKKKMKINEKKEVAQLKEIAFGEAFEFENRIYIKCMDKSIPDEENFLIAAADIETGKILKINMYEIVRPLDAEINILE